MSNGACLSDGSHVTVARLRVRQTRFALHVGSQDPPTGTVDVSPTPGLRSAAASFADSSPPSTAASRPPRAAASRWTADLEALGSRRGELRRRCRRLGTPRRLETELSHFGRTRNQCPPKLVASRQRVATQPTKLTDLSLGSNLERRTHGRTQRTRQRSAVKHPVRGDHGRIPERYWHRTHRSRRHNCYRTRYINPEWVQLDVASNPGGPLSPGIPGQNRPANQSSSGGTVTSSRCCRTRNNFRLVERASDTAVAGLTRHGRQVAYAGIHKSPAGRRRGSATPSS